MATEVYMKSREVAKKALDGTSSGVNLVVLEIALGGFLRDATIRARSDEKMRFRWMEGIAKCLDKDPAYIHKMCMPGIYANRRRNK